MKILITGGAGYVGSHLCKLLRSQSVTHLVYDNFSTGHVRHLGISSHVRGDITNRAALDSCMADFRPDCVIHLAAIATIPDCMTDPERTREVNSEGTRNILESMHAHHVPAIVFASSCGVYAATPTPRPFSESDPLDPPTLYGQTKYQSERLLQRYHDEYNIAYAALRIFNVSGADPESEIGEDHAPETHLLPLIIRAGQTGEPLSLFGNDYATGDGTAVRDYVHVCDVAETAWHCAQSLSKTREALILNTGSGTPTSVLQLIRAVEKRTGKKVPYVISPRRAGDEPYLLGDIQLLRRRFPQLPRRSQLDAIVDSACLWHEANASHR